jgi:hypothetical protein
MEYGKKKKEKGEKRKEVEWEEKWEIEQETKVNKGEENESRG